MREKKGGGKRVGKETGPRLLEKSASPLCTLCFTVVTFFVEKWCDYTDCSFLHSVFHGPILPVGSFGWREGSSFSACQGLDSYSSSITVVSSLRGACCLRPVAKLLARPGTCLLCLSLDI